MLNSLRWCKVRNRFVCTTLKNPLYTKTQRQENIQSKNRDVPTTSPLLAAQLVVRFCVFCVADTQYLWSCHHLLGTKSVCGDPGTPRMLSLSLSAGIGSSPITIKTFNILSSWFQSFTNQNCSLTLSLWAVMKFAATWGRWQLVCLL